MYSSSELIEALAARGRSGLWFRNDEARTAPGEFPAGWEAWFASMRERVGAVTGASAEAIAAIFLRRELSSPAPRSAGLSRWQAFSALWRQQWHAAEPDSARDRIAAMVITVLVHLLLGILLLWIAYVRFKAPPPLGEDVIQVEYIGLGTPDDTGGGALSVQAPTDRAQSQTAASAAAPMPRAPAAAIAPATPAEPAPAAAAQARQPVQVSESSAPDALFVLPPTTTRDVPLAAPTLRMPSVQATERSVQLVEVPAAPALRQVQVVPRTAAPALQQPAQQVRAREIPVLVRPQASPTLAQRPAPSPQLQAPAAQVRTRDVPLAAAPAPTPGTAPASGQAAPASARDGSARTSAASAPGGQPAASSGTRDDTAAAGRGTAPSAAPGGARTPTRGDDWGDSNRNRPEGAAGSPSGLFNADGSPRLPPGAAAAGGGFPPGSDKWNRDDLDRYGTWSKRPPIGYDPTRFDDYWIPSGSLLEEWVRQGVRSLSIPIPGTSKKINCVLSVLQLGGGCGISDPDMQDREAIARPPPDIPYKPELQEGQGASLP